MVAGELQARGQVPAVRRLVRPHLGTSGLLWRWQGTAVLPPQGWTGDPPLQPLLGPVWGPACLDQHSATGKVPCPPLQRGQGLSLVALAVQGWRSLLGALLRAAELRPRGAGLSVSPLGSLCRLASHGRVCRVLVSRCCAAHLPSCPELLPHFPAPPKDPGCARWTAPPRESAAPALVTVGTQESWPLQRPASALTPATPASAAAVKWPLTSCSESHWEVTQCGA